MSSLPGGWSEGEIIGETGLMPAPGSTYPIGVYRTGAPDTGVRSFPPCQCFKAPCDCGSGLTVEPRLRTMDAPDLVGLGQLINDEAQSWYVLTHPGTTIPTVNQGEIRVPGVTASFNTNVLVLGLIVLGAVLLLRNG